MLIALIAKIFHETNFVHRCEVHLLRPFHVQKYQVHLLVRVHGQISNVTFFVSKATTDNLS